MKDFIIKDKMNKENNSAQDLKKRKGKELALSEIYNFEEKLMNDLSCDELFFIEVERSVRGESNQAVKKAIKMKGCKII